MSYPSSTADPQPGGKYVAQNMSHSPLYQHLNAGIEQDEEIVALQELLDKNLPTDRLFFTAINSLLFSEQGKGHSFAEFYPYLTPTPRPPEEAYPHFRDFCLSHAQELRRLLPTVRMQTNEVTRCANLLPAFELVYQRGGRQPLALIEIGASAGFNLFWDHYAYTYHSAHNTVSTIGDQTSSVQIVCTLEGERLPPLPKTMPGVASRIGIDLFPLDCANERDVRWLRAHIFPEEVWRYQLLDAALTMALQNPPDVLAGNASDLLPDLLVTIPSEQPLCLYHSYALSQGPVADRIFHLIAAYSTVRDIYRISLEIGNPHLRRAPRLELFTYQHGEQTGQEWLANCDIHGSEMEWL